MRATAASPYVPAVGAHPLPTPTLTAPALVAASSATLMKAQTQRQPRSRRFDFFQPTSLLTHRSTAQYAGCPGHAGPGRVQVTPDARMTVVGPAARSQDEVRVEGSGVRAVSASVVGRLLRRYYDLYRSL
jgi:hypothetical protein